MTDRLSIPKVSKLFALLSNDVRIWILMSLLYYGPTSYQDLRAHCGIYFDASRHTASGRFAYHLAKIRRFGLITHAPHAGRKYVLTEKGRVVAALIESVANPSSQLLQTAKLAPEILRMVRGIQETNQAASELMQASVSKSLNSAPRFAIEKPSFTESEVRNVIELENIRKRAHRKYDDEHPESVEEFLQRNPH